MLRVRYPDSDEVEYYIVLDCPISHFINGALEIRDGSTPFRTDVYDFGQLMSSSGNGHKPCLHNNVKGEIFIEHPHYDLNDVVHVEQLTAHRVASKSSSAKIFALADINGKTSVENIHPFLPWKLEHEFRASGTKGQLSFYYRYANKPLAFIAEETEETIECHLISEVEGVLTFQGLYRKRRRGSESALDHDPEWGPWEGKGCTVTVRRWIDIFDTVMSASVHMGVEGFKTSCALRLVECINARVDYGDYTSAIADASSGITLLDQNNIENLTQLKGTFTLVPELTEQAVKAYKDPKKMAKFASSLSLAYRYAAKPTMSDAIELVEKSKRILNELRDGGDMDPSVYRGSSRTQVGDISVNAYASLRIRPRAAQGFTKAKKFFDNLGLLPSLSRGADLVPYEFVASWYLNQHEVLQVIDLATRNDIYDVEECMYSTKAQLLVDPPDFASGSKVTISSYERIVLPVLPAPTLMLKHNWGRHTFAGASLVVTAL